LPENFSHESPRQASTIPESYSPFSIYSHSRNRHDTRLLLMTRQSLVAQVSKPAVSPTSKSASHKDGRKPADLEIRDTADWEVCGTTTRFISLKKSF